MNETQYKWHSSLMGGGGYITGIIQDPFKPEQWYARCDVAGVFKSHDGARSWEAVNRGMTDCHHHMVRSIAASYYQPGVLLRASGDVRDHTMFGTLHRSEDGGETWTDVCGEVDFYGNGPTRYCGEVIAFSPHDEQFAIAGGYSKGIWISNDGGNAWNYSGLKGERIVCAAIHPYSLDLIYACTFGERALYEGDDPSVWASNLEQCHDFPRGELSNLFVSRDRGQRWELIHQGLNITELAFDPGDPSALYASTVGQGLMRSRDGGLSWNSISSGLPGVLDYLTVTSNGDNDRFVLYTAGDLRPHHEGLPPFPIYKSEDRGETWSLLAELAEKDIIGFPSYLELYCSGWSICKVRVDSRNHQHLYFSNWFGVAQSKDEGHTWNGYDFTGLNTTCLESVRAHPTRTGIAMFTMGDHNVTVTTDGGKTCYGLPRIPQTHGTTAATFSRYMPELILSGHVRDGGHCIAKYDLAKKAGRIVLILNEGLFVQAMIEDGQQEGVFYAYVDGMVKDGAGLYRSKDWGESWSITSSFLPVYITQLPHKKKFIESDLLAVVVYQIKNVCGTNQLLCSDPYAPGTLYAGEWTEGLFKSLDSGETWSRIGFELPFGAHQSSVLNMIKADPNRPGVFYAGFIREGLWRSEDGGASWHKLFPVNHDLYNASSLAIGNDNELYVVCEPLYWSNSPSSVYCSLDQGQTWKPIMDTSLGALRYKGIDIDPLSGTLYAVTCGNGIYYAERTKGL
ncbi:MAG: hypothetical protein H7X86_04645 [Gorillibacterium sp.]|nr:hypothetical protein [Gorillibacterium sp.]